jgi:TPR repeat protein
MVFSDDPQLKQRAEQWCQQGKELLKQSQWHESHQCFLESIRLNPQHGESLLSISRAYQQGYGVEESREKSIFWLRRAAECGFPEAENELGSRYHNGESIPQDYSQAFFWYYRAAQNGYTLGEYNLGDAYYNGKGVDVDQSAAFWWYLKAAEHGDADAQYCMWRAFFHGQGVGQDHALATRWLEKAALQGYRMAQYNLGVSYEYGYGIEKDDSIAISWYSKAARQDDPPAIKALDRFEAVLFLVGSHCVGKTTLTRFAKTDGIRIIVELAADEISKAPEKIRQTLASARRVILEAVLCNDPAIPVERMLYRALNAPTNGEIGIVHRTVDMARSFAAFPAAIESLVQEFDGTVEFIIVNNSGELKDATFHPVSKIPSPLVERIVNAQSQHLKALAAMRPK